MSDIEKIITAEREWRKKMAEYIFEIGEALYNEETGEAVFKPTYKGKIVRCKDCKYNPNNPRPYADDDPIETFIHCQFMGADGFCSKGKARMEVQE